MYWIQPANPDSGPCSRPLRPPHSTPPEDPTPPTRAQEDALTGITDRPPGPGAPSPNGASTPGRRPTVGRLLRAIPGVAAFLGTERGRAMRHWLALRTSRRVHYTFTRFHRSPAQFDALLGPVLDGLVGPARTGSLRVVVIGCSIGAEPYTISSMLLHHCPHLDVTIHGYDVLDAVLDRARLAVYTSGEVLGSPYATPAFIAHTFEREGDDYRVRPDVARRVTFARLDALDPRMPDRVGTADLVYAQNVLMNLTRAQARRAFPGLIRLLRPRSALFIDGVDLDLRVKFTRAAGLTPLDYRVRDIHDEALEVRGGRYPGDYSGLPPYRDGPDAVRRFATIFLNGFPKG